MNILQEMKALEEENKLLKRKLARKTEPTPREQSRKRQSKNSAVKEGTHRVKHCKVCAKLLSKGFTTRFCPSHGHTYKLNRNIS